MAPQITVPRKTAAKMLGMSLDHFERYVQPECRVIYSGRLRLIRVDDLEAWLERNAEEACA